MLVGPFERHRGPVTCAAHVPGTSLVVTSGYDAAVGLFDMDTGAVDLLGYHDHLVNRVTVDPQGHRAVTASSDHTLMLWDLRSRSHARTLLGHSDDVEDFCFIDDRTGASVSRDWRVLIWDLDTGRVTRVLQGHQKDVLSVASHQGRLLTSGDDMTLRVWDIETGRLLRTWGPFDTEADTCAVDAARGRVILGCDDGVIRVFDITTGGPVATWPAHRSAIKKVACSVDGHILSAAYDGFIRVFDGESFRERVQLDPSTTKWERSFNFSADGARVVAGTFDGTVLVWDAHSGALLQELGAAPDQGNACFNDVSVAADGALATVTDAGHVHIGHMDAHRAAWSQRLTPTTGRMLMNAVHVDPQAGLLAAGAHDQRLHLWRWPTLDQPTHVELSEGPINCVRVSHHPDHRHTLFVACYTGAIVRVGPRGAPLGSFRVHDNAVKALRLHPHDDVGVSGSADGVLASWRLDGTLLRRFPGHTAIVDDVDLSPSGRLLASTGRDFTVKVHALDTGLMLHCFELGRRSPKGVCFVGEDVVVVTTYWGELIRVDLAQGTLSTAQISRNGLSAVTPDPSGRWLIASSYDGALLRVDAATLQVHDTLRAMVQRVDGADWAG